MSDSTVTLEDVADWIDDNLVDNGPTRDPQDHDRAAALLRAAQKVVEAAPDWVSHEPWCPALYARPQGCTCGLHAMEAALAAFRKEGGE